MIRNFFRTGNPQPRERVLRLIDEKAPFGFVEAIKSLRTNVDFLASTNNYRTILITSTGPWDGKSTISINLSGAMADSGKKVVLVDCDMRKGSITTYLKIGRNHAGITDVLAGKCHLEEAISHNAELHFDVLAVGSLPSNPSEVIGSPRMIDTLRELSQQYDYVFVDTPPVSVVTDAAILSRFVDGVLLVVRADEATKQNLRLSKKNLEAVNANILGAVLNGYNAKNHGYGSSYYYSYGYDENSD